MNDMEERLIRMETKLDLIREWMHDHTNVHRDHNTLHTRLGVGFVLLMASIVIGIVVGM